MINKKKVFIMVELIVILVIFSILLLIVLNVIKKIQIASYKRSIELYANSVENAIFVSLLDNDILFYRYHSSEKDGEKILYNPYNE